MAESWRSAIRAFLARPTRVDWLLACVVTLAAEVEVLIRVPQPSLEKELDALAGLTLLGLAWWRQRPLIPLFLLTASGVASVLGGARIPMAVPQVTQFFAVYSLGTFAGNFELGAGALLPVAMAVAIDLILPNPPVPLWDGVAWYLIFVTGAPLFIGRVVRSRSRLVERLQQQRIALVAERDAAARQAVTAERQRISRRLRSVVIYSVDSLISDVATAEADRGEPGLAAVVRIESAARKALGNMRPLLGALRQQDTEAPASQRKPTTEAFQISARQGTARRIFAVLDATPWPAILAALVFVLLEARIQGSAALHGPRLLVDASLIGIAAPIVWSRKRPLAAAAISVIALFAVSRFVIPIPIAGLQSAVLALYLPFSVAAFNGWRKAVVGLVVCAAGFIATYGLDVAPAIVFGAGAWVAGRLLEDRTRLARELEIINRNLSDERGLRARELVVEERLRVARELHDVIGHTLTVVVLQAGAARRNWETDRARAARALSSLGSVARGGLTQLLASLDVVDETAEATPSGPVFRDVEALVEQARSVGVRVAFVSESLPAVLNQRLELTTYRVIQEALTNVMKHAPKSLAHVRIRSTAGCLHVEVLNSGPLRDRQNNTTRVGHGLAGMAQRVEADGGELIWGRDSAGGFAVKARLPIEELV